MQAVESARDEQQYDGEKLHSHRPRYEGHEKWVQGRDVGRRSGRKSSKRIRQQPLNLRLASPEEANRERGRPGPGGPAGRGAPPKKPFRKEGFNRDGGNFNREGGGGFKARKPKP